MWTCLSPHPPFPAAPHPKITARWFEGPSDGPDAGQGALVPGLDSLNHRNDCPVSFSMLPCPALQARTEAGADEDLASAALKAAQSNEVCVIARTAEEIPAGEEVCISYGNIAPDVTLLQYGGCARAGGLDRPCPWLHACRPLPRPCGEAARKGALSSAAATCALLVPAQLADGRLPTPPRAAEKASSPRARSWPSPASTSAARASRTSSLRRCTPPRRPS